MKNIWKHYIILVRNYKKQFILFLLLLIIAWAFSSLEPLFFKWFTDTIINKNWFILVRLLIFLAIFELLYNIFDTFTWRLLGLLRINIARDTRLKVFSKLQELDMSYHVSRSTGSTISILKRGDSAIDTVLVIFFMFLGGPLFSFIVTFVILAMINIPVAISVLIFAILFLLTMKFLLENNFKWRRAYHDSEDKITGKIGDSLMNMVTVKHFAKEKWEDNCLFELFKPWTNNYVNYDKSFKIMDFIANMIKTLNIITALFIGFYYFKQGLITAGSFILLFSAIMKINNELHYLIYNYREFNKALVDVEKYLSILEEVPLVKDPEINTDIKDVDTRIELKNVTFNYPGNTNNVFKNLNLTINSNEKIALVGKSGAGKTTIVTLLLRFYDVVSGGIYIDGINVKNFKKKDLRSLFGIVPQDPIMFNDTIKYNICYGKQKASMSEIIQACKTANIYDFIESLPEKFDTQVGERGIKLSGGQKQRLAIARVVLSNPKIIVFDEATSQLDSESEKEIQDAFWKIAQTKTTIIIAHRLSTVIHADRIIVFDKGKIIESGNHKDLTELKGIYYKLWKIQSSNISDNIPA